MYIQRHIVGNVFVQRLQKFKRNLFHVFFTLKTLLIIERFLHPRRNPALRIATALRSFFHVVKLLGFPSVCWAYSGNPHFLAQVSTRTMGNAPVI